ncbi:peptidyl-tRNA hydrolase [Streptomyces sp. NPDC005438]|uniref:aminoacyl-tRNA hydrolase n=1 Tax=Streptomyces sp. NPDC005438 TaxID=3156880 RepID=UPI0033AECEAE
MSTPAPDDPFQVRPSVRDQELQYVLPLVLRREKADPPALTDALETSARAVLTLLGDERSQPGGPWAPLVRAWEDARIRKVVRRARGAAWARAEALEGVTVRGREALVRVYPPVPLDGWPPELAALQVSGTELSDPEPVGPPPEGVPVCWLNPEVEMSAGKAMAQTGHAAQLAWWELSAPDRERWRADGYPLAVRSAAPGRWDQLLTSGLPLVRDAGFTEVAPGSSTALMEHPALAGGRR